MASFSIPLTGLVADSTALNTIANDLSNMNTTAFKAETSNFSDLFYQQIGSNGAGNPIQVGAGVKVASNEIAFTQGSFNSTGNANTANGFQALFSNQDGYENTASGFNALFANTSGQYNTASGTSALKNNTTGHNNTADGGFALLRNTTGSDNTGSGYRALFANTTGFDNTAAGAFALNDNTTGIVNTAFGHSALTANTSGGNNTALGAEALFNNTTGSNNIAIGFNAGQSIDTGSSNIDIGNSGVVGDSNTIRIGSAQAKTFIAGISGTTAASGVAVFVNTNGQLGTLTSSARFKENIRGMDDKSDALFGLRPVTFRYKAGLDPAGMPQFGLVAEEVEQVNPDLVVRDDKNQIYTVRYEAVNAMLLNEFLKEHRKVEQQTAKLQELSRKVDLQNRENADLKGRLDRLEKFVRAQSLN